MDLVPAGDDRIWVDPRYRKPLVRAGLGDFRAIMNATDGRCLRALRDRENWRLEIDNGQFRQGIYLKKHHFRTLGTWLRAKLGLRPHASPARVEADNARALTAQGIGAMDVVAYGETFHADGRVESFLLTQELAGYLELHKFFRKRFPHAAMSTATRRDPDLNRLIRTVAELARRFHRSGYNHRDLYCCHFFVREPSPGQFEIRMIDLQRVQRRRWFRWRWIVKDLAQLAWSAPRDCIKCTHKLAFLRHYLGVRKLRLRDKRLIREVLVKQQIMERRSGIE